SSSSSVIEIASSSSTPRNDSTISTSRGDSEAKQSSSSSSSRGDSETSSSSRGDSEAKQSSSSTSRGDSETSSSSRGDSEAWQSSSSRGDSEAWQSSSSTSRGDGAVWLSNLLPIVSGDTLKNAVTVSGENIRIDVPYALSLNNSLSHIQFVGIDSSYDLRSAKTLNLLSEDSLLTAYRVIAEVQLPGSDFSKREDSFWATTSDAMATEGTAKVVANYTFTSAANLLENGNSLTLTSRIVSCAWAGITGGKKLATGIYFAGSYAGEDAMNIYDVSYDGGTPSTGTSDITSQMTFGRPFYGRPKAFELTYSYEHVDGKNADYPQKGLAYVILVSKNSQAIAVGAITWESSDAYTSTVELSDGADPDGVLSAGYAGTSDLILGSGDEEVTSIRIVFASSAFAHVVAGGSSVLNDPSKDFRGGDGSSLTIENFKLVYE
ncbi:MAG: PCMD domain-containing protein, partial [Fibrobacter sp.]|nr:PCMD domain-containing protein [Fibrobacter sp.]